MASHSSILAWETPWSLVGYSPWGYKELDTTEPVHRPKIINKVPLMSFSGFVGILK